MNPLVPAEGTLSSEFFPTLCTCEWFLPCMNQHMLEEALLLRKAFITLCTCEWFLPCMNPLVIEKGPLST
ncbi:hypothetical protein FKM82_007334 [Ascaphus truei]